MAEVKTENEKHKKIPGEMLKKKDDHKCLPTIIKLRIFIVINQSLKLNYKKKT